MLITWACTVCLHRHCCFSFSRTGSSSKAQVKHGVEQVDAYLRSGGFSQAMVQRTQHKQPENTNCAQTSRFMGNSSDVPPYYSPVVVTRSEVRNNQVNASHKWSTEHTPFESLWRGNKLHLASPQEFLTPASFQNVSERETGGNCTVL